MRAWGRGGGGAGWGGEGGRQPSQTVNETAGRCREGGQGAEQDGLKSQGLMGQRPRSSGHLVS